MRGVTAKLDADMSVADISTHTPHARRDEAQYQMTTDYVISTHTPHARRDASTEQNFHGMHISTHTPHARRD
mgnify:CR=1 FL=1